MSARCNTSSGINHREHVGGGTNVECDVPPMALQKTVGEANSWPTTKTPPARNNATSSSRIFLGKLGERVEAKRIAFVADLEGIGIMNLTGRL